MALEQFVRSAVCEIFDEHERRLSTVEDTLRQRSFTVAELRRQRRAAVLHARGEGLSVALIARALGLSRHTVADILTEEESKPPERVLGGDGRLYHRRNGDRSVR